MEGKNRMLSRFLFASYHLFFEIFLWLLFVYLTLGGAVIGSQFGIGVGGFFLGLTIAFVVAIFFVIPLMLLSDLRKTTARIERLAANAVQNMAKGEGGSSVLPTGQKRSDDLIKMYKGHEIIKHVEGVSVDGQILENVLKAEAYIDKMAKQPGLT